MPRRLAAALSIVLASATVWDGAGAQPQPPATFFGAVTITGGGARSPSADLRAHIGEVDCTQIGPAVRVLVEGDTVNYVVHVLHESQRAGCGKPGAPVRFLLDDVPAGATGRWEPGPNALDLRFETATPSGTTATAAVPATPPAAQTTASTVTTGTPTAPSSSVGAASVPSATATLSAIVSGTPPASPDARPGPLPTVGPGVGRGGGGVGLVWPAIGLGLVAVALGGWWLNRKRPFRA